MERHPLSERFHELLAMCGNLHDKKQADYGRENDPFANIRGSLDFGVPPWIGAMLRGNDKMRRIQKAAAQVLAGEDIDLENESMGNSLFDLAVYCLIAVVMYEEEHGVQIHPPELEALAEQLFNAGAIPEGKLVSEFKVDRDLTGENVLHASRLEEFAESLKAAMHPSLERCYEIREELNRLQARTHEIPDVLFLWRERKEGEPRAKHSGGVIWGIPVYTDPQMDQDEFIFRVNRGGSVQIVEFHHYRFKT